MKHRLRFPIKHFLIASFWGLFLITYSQSGLANNVDDFIQSIHVSTYDCPDDKFKRQVDEYLKRSMVLPKQPIQIKVHI